MTLSFSEQSRDRLGPGRWGFGPVLDGVLSCEQARRLHVGRRIAPGPRPHNDFQARIVSRQRTGQKLPWAAQCVISNLSHEADQQILIKILLLVTSGSACKIKTFNSF